MGNRKKNISKLFASTAGIFGFRIWCNVVIAISVFQWMREVLFIVHYVSNVIPPPLQSSKFIEFRDFAASRFCKDLQRLAIKINSI